MQKNVIDFENNIRYNKLYWYEGKLRREGQFKNDTPYGIPIGTFKYYDEEGNHIFSHTYKNGRISEIDIKVSSKYINYYMI